MKKKHLKSKGQAIVEYIIIIVIVAVAALTVMGIFSDRIREIIGGAAASFGADSGNVDAALQNSSRDILTNIDKDGIEE